MTETSRGRVTITLGGNGRQVVKKRSGSPPLPLPIDDYDDDFSSRKRSVRDRLGTNFNTNKRQRGEFLNHTHVHAGCIGKNDLRFKLLQKKNIDDRKVVDLRERLSRTGQPSPSMLDSRQQHMPHPKDTSVLRQMPSATIVDDLPRMDSSGQSYSPYTVDHIRCRSPDRMLRSSRGLSPPRIVEELPRRPPSRTYDDVRTVSYLSEQPLDSTRPVSSLNFMSKPILPTASSKPLPIASMAPPLMVRPPSGPRPSIMPKSSYVHEEPQTVDGLLQSLGLGKYAILFKAEEIDMSALKQMGESDLKELGIPMGPRKKILLAVLPRLKRQP